ncbi:ankyrin repeat-containing domain protein [Mycena maculata]|uniref:Ankyrin repeat-containing domain protein n=1 Tax=Mycena maculata TaxID=230809 RepID=A0AAD7JNQ2_9AGAR|nr:ankyrin repeat-containing domain protein [Mycena maculata]
MPESFMEPVAPFNNRGGTPSHKIIGQFFFQWLNISIHMFSYLQRHQDIVFGFSWSQEPRQGTSGPKPWVTRSLAPGLQEPGECPILTPQPASSHKARSPHSPKPGRFTPGFYIDVVCLLLDNGADGNLQHPNYASPLEFASLPGHIDMVHLLLERGADVDLKSRLGAGGTALVEGYGTALEVTSQSGHIESMHLLVKSGADVGLHSEQYPSALELSSGESHIEIMHLLLSNGTDVNFQSREGAGALVTALQYGHTELALLLERGADMETQGSNTLQATYSNGQAQIVEVLLEDGARN